MNTVNDILASQSLPALPLRAWLHHEPAKNSFFPDWTLFYDWTSHIDEPGLCFRNLVSVDLDGAECLVLHGKAARPLHGRTIMTDEDEVEFVYILNPSDSMVRHAVESWISRQLASHRVGKGWGYHGEVSSSVVELMQPRAEHGLDLRAESASLAAVLANLIQDGRLEKLLASKLQIERPVYCTIVETELILEALAGESVSQ